MYQRVRVLRTIGCFALLLALFPGCGGGGDGFKGERGSVTGKITFDGKPIPEGSQVVFIGTQGGYTAAGAVKVGGEYSLKYNGSSQLPAIKYQVQISPPTAAAKSEKSEKSIDPANLSGTLKTPSKSAKTEETGPFPSKYYSRNTSTLEFTVKAGSNPANFELTK